MSMKWKIVGEFIWLVGISIYVYSLFMPIKKGKKFLGVLREMVSNIFFWLGLGLIITGASIRIYC